MSKQSSTSELEDYKVTIGEDIFAVRAADNLSARYEGSDQFRKKHSFDNIPLTLIVEFARAKLVTPLEPVQTTEEVLNKLREANKGRRKEA